MRQEHILRQGVQGDARRLVRQNPEACRGRKKLERGPCMGGKRALHACLGKLDHNPRAIGSHGRIENRRGS